MTRSTRDVLGSPRSARPSCWRCVALLSALPGSALAQDPGRARTPRRSSRRERQPRQPAVRARPRSRSALTCSTTLGVAMSTPTCSSPATPGRVCSRSPPVIIASGVITYTGSVVIGRATATRPSATASSCRRGPPTAPPASRRPAQISVDAQPQFDEPPTVADPASDPRDLASAGGPATIAVTASDLRGISDGLRHDQSCGRHRPPYRSIRSARRASGVSGVPAHGSPPPSPSRSRRSTTSARPASTTRRRGASRRRRGRAWRRCSIAAPCLRRGPSGRQGVAARCDATSDVAWIASVTCAAASCAFSRARGRSAPRRSDAAAATSQHLSVASSRERRGRYQGCGRARAATRAAWTGPATRRAWRLRALAVPAVARHGARPVRPGPCHQRLASDWRGARARGVRPAAASPSSSRCSTSTTWLHWHARRASTTASVWDTADRASASCSSAVARSSGCSRTSRGTRRPRDADTSRRTARARSTLAGEDRRWTPVRRPASEPEVQHDLRAAPGALRISKRSVSCAIRHSPRPRPGLSGRGDQAHPVVVDVDDEQPVARRARRRARRRHRPRRDRDRRAGRRSSRPR